MQSSQRFAITEELSGSGRMVIHVSGELDQTHADELASAIGHGAEHGVEQVVLDLMGCEFIDSAGLGAFRRGAKQLEDAGGGRILVACGGPEVRRLFTLTAIDRSVVVLDSVPQLRSA